MKNIVKNIARKAKSLFSKKPRQVSQIDREIANTRFTRVPAKHEHARFNPKIKKTRKEWDSILEYRKKNKGRVWELMHKRKAKGKNKVRFNKETGKFWTQKGNPYYNKPRPPVMKQFGGHIVSGKFLRQGPIR